MSGGSLQPGAGGAPPRLAAPRASIRRMTVDALDPLIHVSARLRIVATLAALPDGDALSFTRLQEMTGLTPGNLITHLRKPEDAGYVTSEKTGNGPASRTSVAPGSRGRAHLHRDLARSAQPSMTANSPGRLSSRLRLGVGAPL